MLSNEIYRAGLTRWQISFSIFLRHLIKSLFVTSLDFLQGIIGDDLSCSQRPEEGWCEER